MESGGWFTKCSLWLIASVKLSTWAYLTQTVKMTTVNAGCLSASSFCIEDTHLYSLEQTCLRQFKRIFTDNCQRTSQEEGAHGIFSHVHWKPRVTEAVQWTYRIWYCADYICRKESINPEVNRALTQKQRRKLQSNHFCFLFLSGHVLEYTSISRLNTLDKLIQRQHLLNKVF